jgi:hypothetical protein
MCLRKRMDMNTNSHDWDMGCDERYREAPCGIVCIRMVCAGGLMYILPFLGFLLELMHLERVYGCFCLARKLKQFF